MKVHKKFIKSFSTLLITALLFAALPTGLGTAQTTVTVCASGCDYTSIQLAHNNAAPGDTIIVKDGTYDITTEPIATVGLVNIYKQITIKAEEDGNSIRPKIDASGRDGVFKIHANGLSGGAIVIEGFEITGDAITGTAITGMYCDDPIPPTVSILDNKIHSVNAGLNFWGSGTWCDSSVTSYVIKGVEIKENTFTNLGTSGEKVFAIALEGLSNSTTTGGAFAAVIEGNTFSTITDGTLQPGAGVAIVAPGSNEAANAKIVNNTFSDVSIGVGVPAGDVTEIEVQYNQFGSAMIGIYNQGTGTANASPNWWGNMSGPTAGQYSGSVDYDPWCGDAECSFTVSADDTGTGDFYFNAAGQLVISGSVDVPGGISITEDGLWIWILSGTVIQNNSPCFTVNANNVTIEGASPGVVTCIPTDDSAGIEVAAGVSGLVIKNLDIDGSQTTGPAIDFAGDITDVQILNNKIHDFSADGIVFGNDVLTSHVIQGNMFMNIAGDEIVFSGTTPYLIDATFNSWGANAPPWLYRVGNFPFTHANLWVESSGALSGGKVARGNSVTYTVYADLTEISDAEFNLTYPTSLLTLTGITEGDGEFVGAPLLNSTTPGLIEFRGVPSGTGPVTGTGVALFTATFDAADTLPDPNTGAMELVEIPEGFSMTPDDPTTTHVYPAELLDGEVTVVEVCYLPIIVTD